MTLSCPIIEEWYFGDIEMSITLVNIRTGRERTLWWSIHGGNLFARTPKTLSRGSYAGRVLRRRLHVFKVILPKTGVLEKFAFPEFWLRVT